MVDKKITDNKLTKKWALIEYIHDIKNKVTKLIYHEPAIKAIGPILKNRILENKSIKKLNIKQAEDSLVYRISEAKELLAKNLQEFKNYLNIHNYSNKEEIENKSLLILLWSKRFSAYGFSTEQIVKMATGYKGSENFELIDVHHDKFFALKYSSDNLVNICSLKDGHNLLIYILNNGELLKKLYDNNDQIIESLHLYKKSVMNKVNQILTYKHSLQARINGDCSSITRTMLIKYQQLNRQQTVSKLDGNIIDNKVNVVDHTKLAFLVQNKM